ncbi:hypothetical protein RRG08_003306 [Elysia crispata]|uniref:Uncharacterized protein n=1 Tax=Elysia crispata TaxID=231223 RepID=A0AAE0ZRT8_9GAST|nr:hypothetical protein RRG08_003306 [Elysia crispata]
MGKQPPPKGGLLPQPAVTICCCFAPQGKANPPRGQHWLSQSPPKPFPLRFKVAPETLASREWSPPPLALLGGGETIPKPSLRKGFPTGA